MHILRTNNLVIAQTTSRRIAVAIRNTSLLLDNSLLIQSSQGVYEIMLYRARKVVKSKIKIPSKTPYRNQILPNHTKTQPQMSYRHFYPFSICRSPPFLSRLFINQPYQLRKLAKSWGTIRARNDSDSLHSLNRVRSECTD